MSSETFDQQETKRQQRVKARCWPGLPDGTWRGASYRHILPDAHKIENLYPAIRDAVPDYAASRRIELHSEFANLKSSQVCCLNFLFPLRTRREAAAARLHPLLPSVRAVDEIEFEYTGPEDDGATAWLGEPPAGKRGQNRTSADAAIWWRDGENQRRLTLVEWKYTESEFGTCGGFASRGNRRRERCLRRAVPPTTYGPWHCYLCELPASRGQRRYWEHLDAGGIDLSRHAGDACPFSGPFYQLMRLQLLAAYLRIERVADVVDVAAVHFRANSALEKIPLELRPLGGDVSSAWRSLLRCGDGFRVCHADSLAEAIRESQFDQALSQYLQERYGV